MTDDSLNDRLLSREVCETIWQRIQQLASGGGRTGIRLTSYWNGEIRWARNEVHLSSDRRYVRLDIERRVNGRRGVSFTERLDDASLENTIRECERIAAQGKNGRPSDFPLVPASQPVPTPLIWSDATYNVPVITRAKLVQLLTQQAAAKGLVAAGYLEVRGVTEARAGGGMPNGLHQVWNGFAWKDEMYDPALDGVLMYNRMTQAQCSMTVRHPQGTGSGWAGSSSFDWNQVDGAALAEEALEKCVASLNPVRIEPGRYTVILEPQAVHSLVRVLSFSREVAEDGQGPWPLGPDPSLGIVRTKLGLKVVDERITLSHDPMDPVLGVVPEPGLAPVTYIERGVLKTLTYSQHYGVTQLRETEAAIPRFGIRMSGGTTSMDEMISTTQRGLLVTRFSGLTVLDRNVPLVTGVTRDGLWLIEQGKVTKAVNNMRITESPLFVLNRIEQLGVPAPVFEPVQKWTEVGLYPSIVPPIKANDFSFTSTVDAI